MLIFFSITGTCINLNLLYIFEVNKDPKRDEIRPGPTDVPVPPT